MFKLWRKLSHAKPPPPKKQEDKLVEEKEESITHHEEEEQDVLKKLDDEIKALEALSSSETKITIIPPTTSEITSQFDKIVELKNTAQYDQAQKLAEDCYDQNKAAFGLAHSNTTRALAWVGELLLLRGKFQQAFPILIQVCEIQKRVLGLEKEETVIALNNLASLYHILARNDQAEILFRQVIELDTKIITSELSIATHFNNFAEFLRETGKYEESKLYFDKAIQIWKKYEKDFSHQLAISLTNLGCLLHDMGNLEESKIVQEKAISLLKSISSSNTASVENNYEETMELASCYNSLSSLLYSMENFDEAEIICSQSLLINNKLFNQVHPKIGTNLSNLGAIMEKKGNLKEAERLYLEALQVYLATIGETDHFVLDTLWSLKDVSTKLGKNEEAQQFQERAVKVALVLFGENHSVTQALLQSDS